VGHWWRLDRHNSKVGFPYTGLFWPFAFTILHLTQFSVSQLSPQQSVLFGRCMPLPQLFAGAARDNYSYVLHHRKFFIFSYLFRRITEKDGGYYSATLPPAPSPPSPNSLLLLTREGPSGTFSPHLAKPHVPSNDTLSFLQSPVKYWQLSRLPATLPIPT
jgi:hypothetical protein